MFKRNIKYVDFNGKERDEDFYFHLSLPEVARIEAEYSVADEEMTIKDIIESKVANRQNKEVLDFIEKLILMSYGEKTVDGRSFRKNDELREEFSNSQAYAEFFEQLLTVKGLAVEFGEKVADNGQDRKKKNTLSPTVLEDVSKD